MKYIFLIVFLTLNYVFSFAQSTPFSIYLEPITIPEVGGIQAYAFGQANGKWLIVGGRLDGLHRRQPFASFDLAGNNNQLIVIDPVNKQKWSTSLATLPTSIQEHLSATNMQFSQEGDVLYILGGYGYNAAMNVKKTFNFLTAINVPAVISAITNSTAINSAFRQIADNKFAVTGGHLKKINAKYYLLGGNKFDGDYNPMGNPTYTQAYTNAIRKFNINDNGTTITITHFPEIVDVVNLHRRDYNAVSQIFAGGEEGIIMFSGVFQHTVDLPFLNCVIVDSANYVVNNTFQQYYNHYHCPVLPVYSEQSNEMHNIFFGGIAQYFDNAGTLTQDNNVPFVNTIARVTRDQFGNMTEYKLPITMPGLLGASAEFIENRTLAKFNNGVIKLDSLVADTNLVGYIYGGISSTAANVFFSNNGTQSSASSQLFKVMIIKGKLTGNDELNLQSSNSIQLQLMPNPSRDKIGFRLNLIAPESIVVTLTTKEGKLIKSVEYKNLEAGQHIKYVQFNDEIESGVFFINVQSAKANITQKLIYFKD